MYLRWKTAWTKPGNPAASSYAYLVKQSKDIQSGRWREKVLAYIGAINPRLAVGPQLADLTNAMRRSLASLDVHGSAAANLITRLVRSAEQRHKASSEALKGLLQMPLPRSLAEMLEKMKAAGAPAETIEYRRRKFSEEVHRRGSPLRPLPGAGGSTGDIHVAR